VLTLNVAALEGACTVHHVSQINDARYLVRYLRGSTQGQYFVQEVMPGTCEVSWFALFATGYFRVGI
jgi:hypothetical protein